MAQALLSDHFLIEAQKRKKNHPPCEKFCLLFGRSQVEIDRRVKSQGDTKPWLQWQGGHIMDRSFVGPWINTSKSSALDEPQSVIREKGPIVWG